MVGFGNCTSGHNDTAMKTLLLPILILSALIPSAISAADADTNVLLIITDEHNFRTLGCYRDLLPREQAEMWGADVVVPTPHLDSLAADGVICTRAYATAPVCSPCRAAMITGRYPHATGVPTNDRVLDRTIPTLADRLNDAGYRTTFIGKWHLGGTGKPEWSPKVDGGFQFKEFMYNRGHWKKFEIVDGKPRVASRRNGNPNYDVGGADSQSFSTDWLTDRGDRLHHRSRREETVLYRDQLSRSARPQHGSAALRSPLRRLEILAAADLPDRYSVAEVVGSGQKTPGISRRGYVALLWHGSVH